MKRITVTYRVTLMPLDADEAYDNVMDALGRFKTRSLIDAEGKGGWLVIMHSANTGLLRSVMDPSGTITGVAPHRPVGSAAVDRPPGGRQVSARLDRRAAPEPRGRGLMAHSDWLQYSLAAGHSWAGIHRDWRGWSRHVVPGGSWPCAEVTACLGAPTWIVSGTPVR